MGILPKLLPVFSGVLLAGCLTDSGMTPQQAAATLPPNYRAIIVDRIKTTFFDPYSIRDAAISAPMPFSDPLMGNGASICVRANAKNRMGGYTGLKPTVFTFRRGVLSGSDSEYAALACSSAVYEPFPEIDAVTAAAKPR